MGEQLDILDQILDSPLDGNILQRYKPSDADVDRLEENNPIAAESLFETRYH